MRGRGNLGVASDGVSNVIDCVLISALAHLPQDVRTNDRLTSLQVCSLNRMTKFMYICMTIKDINIVEILCKIRRE